MERLTLLRLPECTDEPSGGNKAELLVAAVGEVFQAVHAMFEREPDSFSALSGGAVLVPLYAAQQAEKNKRDDELLSVLFDNLDYPFSMTEFTAFLDRKQPLAAYENAMLTDGEDSFWTAVSRTARQEEFARLMSAMSDLMHLFAAKSVDNRLDRLRCRCNLVRMEDYCGRGNSAEQELSALTECYHRAMRGAEADMPEEERAALLELLIYYTAAETDAGEAVREVLNRAGFPVTMTAEDYECMADTEQPREMLDSLYHCTDEAAGEFWKTLYSSAQKAEDEDAVTETAVHLCALMTVVGNESKTAEMRNRLFALVV